MRYYLRLILVSALFLSTSVWAMGGVSSLRINSPLINKEAPEQLLYDSDGKTANVIASRQGSRAILVFWATWCENCYGELGTLYGQLPTIEHKGIKVILIDIGENKDRVNQYFLRRQMKLKSFLDSDSAMPEPYHLIGVPTMVFIDEKGIIRSMTHAFPPDYENYFRS